MKVFDNLKAKTIDELAEWLDENMMFEGSPYLEWWDKNYCQKCVEEESKYAWCELNDKCKFFQEMAEIPNTKEMIKMWLESEYEETLDV